MIKNNLNKIYTTIQNTTPKNKTDKIELVAVSKTKPVEDIIEAYEAGQRTFGENKVQDFVSKYEYFKEKGYSDIKWHFIGHLQSNKAKHIAYYADVFHCLDSAKLGRKLNKYAKESDRVLEVFIQINSSHEEQKHGIGFDEVDDLIKSLEDCDNLKISGIMSIGEFNEDPELSREEFIKMSEKFENLKLISQKNVEMKYLSMGMSNDFHIAIEEGANVVRIGTSIFGERDYSK